LSPNSARSRRPAQLRSVTVLLAAQRFHNHSPLDFQKLKGDPDHLAQHLVSYIKGFSANVRRIFEYFEFDNEIEKMNEAGIVFLVVSKFAEVDLHPHPRAEPALCVRSGGRRNESGCRLG
jgi:hypothetical protein